MAGNPGTSSPLIHDFTDDEIEVANIIVSLKALISLFEPRSLVPLPPSWLSKRPRSSSASSSSVLSSTKSRLDQKRGNSTKPPATVSGEGNPRDVSPDSPLLLKASPDSCVVQGLPEPTQDKKGRKKQGRPLQEGCKKHDDDDGDDDSGVDDSAGINISKKKFKKETMGSEPDFPLQIDVTLSLGSQPHGDRTSPALPPRPPRTLLLDLNLLPESPEEQSPLPPDEKDSEPGPPPSPSDEKQQGRC